MVNRERLLVGNTGDGCLKSIDLDSKRTRTLVSLGAGVIDGIRAVGDAVLVSHWEGQLYHLSAQGEPVEILDTMSQEQNCADFEFIEDRNLIVVLTFVANRVVAYRLVR